MWYTTPRVIVRSRSQGTLFVHEDFLLTRLTAMLFYLVLVLQSITYTYSADCTCTTVDVMAVSLAELVNCTALYEYAATSTGKDDVDSVCHVYRETHTPDTALYEQVVTYTNKSTAQSASLVKPIQPGVFRFDVQPRAIRKGRSVNSFFGPATNHGLTLDMMDIGSELQKRHEVLKRLVKKRSPVMRRAQDI
ncbi:hypothetical protein J6590_059657 [Homalodisca vitripennis]|nr:hypothetical protein J6590_059657 [Homalodisca vitripennis]